VRIWQINTILTLKKNNKMKKLIIAGFIGNDAEVKDLTNGQVINFNVAVSEKIKEETKTTWFKCARFTNNVAIAPYLKKGTYVIVEGKPDVETYQNANGETVANLKCIVDNIHFGGNSKTE
jgi:single-strand DNA-binding protein